MYERSKTARFIPGRRSAGCSPTEDERSHGHTFAGKHTRESTADTLFSYESGWQGSFEEAAVMLLEACTCLSTRTHQQRRLSARHFWGSLDGDCPTPSAESWDKNRSTANGCPPCQDCQPHGGRRSVGILNSDLSTCVDVRKYYLYQCFMIRLSLTFSRRLYNPGCAEPVTNIWVIFLDIASARHLVATRMRPPCPQRNKSSIFIRVLLLDD
ncbi:hypothetical protein BV25DRAFT_300391 [Artomyces pyxidatus]|uniref:Uncharacterized protein n=1 Tax=Artomyces pyxidatus TaxID=48021 RepID=A0ACB8T8D2_9AGAM|nr:hypothetical protein BV25DRAFT_300391 [Artomyces pyxidatus]